MAHVEERSNFARTILLVVLASLATLAIFLYGTMASAVNGKLDKEVYYTDRQNIQTNIQEIKEDLKAIRSTLEQGRIYAKPADTRGH